MKDPITVVAGRRNKISAALCSLTGVWDAHVVSRATEFILADLPQECRYDAVYRSVTPFVGKAPTPQELRKLAWAAAGNVKALKAGVPVWPPQISGEAKPATLRFLAGRRLPDKNGQEPKIAYTALIVSGVGCPTEITITWPPRFVRYLAVRPGGLGFAKPPRGNRPAPPGRPYQSWECLVGMTVAAMVKLGDGNRVSVEDVRCTTLMRGYNQAITEMRFRSGFRCPFDFTHPCHRCPKGQNSCPVAVRPQDLIQLDCSKCGPSTADPHYDKDTCTRCLKRSMPVLDIKLIR